jgi:hypothetical protein
MRLIKTITLLLLTITVKGQNKQETEEWILSKLNTYSIGGIKFTGPSFSKDGQYEINDGYLKLHESGSVIYAKINEFADYSYEIRNGFNDENFGNIPTFVNVYLKCKNGSDCVTYFYPKDNKIYLKKNTFEIMLNHNFKNDNLPERMKKAFYNLVKFNGGQTVSEKY